MAARNSRLRDRPRPAAGLCGGQRQRRRQALSEMGGLMAVDDKAVRTAVRAAIDAGDEEAVHVVAYHDGRKVIDVWDGLADPASGRQRSEEHTSELQSLMRISYAVFCLKKKQHGKRNETPTDTSNYTKY